MLNRILLVLFIFAYQYVNAISPEVNSYVLSDIITMTWDDHQCNNNTDSNNGGIPDCIERSDNKTKECNKTLEIREIQNMCTAPAYPLHGSYVARPFEVAPGSVCNKMFLNVTCEPGYKLKGSQFIFCNKGIWPFSMPECIGYCELNPDPSVKYYCMVNDNAGNTLSVKECGTLVPSGTVVRPECRTPNYYHAGIHSFMHCIDGVWDHVATCELECGILDPQRDIADEADMPWNVAIYKTQNIYHKRVCPGSLISASAVLSAANCFWNKLEMKTSPASDFAIAAGKIDYELSFLRDDSAQKRMVMSINTLPRYRPKGISVKDDIAVLIVEKPFDIGPYLRPVCLDSDSNFNKNQLMKGNVGKTIRQGCIRGDVMYPNSIIIDTYIDNDNCPSNNPSWIYSIASNASDKVCARNYNDSTKCTINSGEGLVFEAKERGIERYYLRGVLSIVPNNRTYTGGLEYNSIVAYTEVFRHNDFILESLAYSKWQCGDKTTIHAGLKSNGVTDCPDGSDEASDLCNTTETNISQNSLSHCVLPEMPKHGTYTVKGLTVVKVGKILPSFHLNVTCNPGYTLLGSSSVECSNGNWSSGIPQCIRACILKPSPSVEYRCTNSTSGGERSAPCEETQPADALVKPVCREPFYYSSQPLRLMRCVDGVWDYIPTCRQAAHCFWGGIQDLGPPQYAVKVGKLLSTWDNGITQRINVKSIKIPDSYHDADGNYQDDIAVVVLARAIAYTQYARPACLEFDTNFNRRQLRSGAQGMVGGRGLLNAGDEKLTSLESFHLPLMDINQCLNASPRHFHEYLTADKLCAGHLNGTSTSACLVHGGGGWVFPEVEKQTWRYYLRGVLSTVPIPDNSNDNGSCYSFPMITFTELFKHENFLRKHIRSDFNVRVNVNVNPNDTTRSEKPTPSKTSENQPSDKCVLPPQPENGMYFVIHKEEDHNRTTSFAIMYSCFKGFGMLEESIVVSNSTAGCSNGIWTGKKNPQCLQTCHLRRHESMVYNCVTNETEFTRPCRDYEVEGTVIQPSCKKPNYYTPSALPYMVCRQGEWSSSPTCLPECGKPTPKGTQLIKLGNTIRFSDMPWHADIYSRNLENDTHDHICVGSLISNSVVLSAARCFWDEEEKKLSNVIIFSVAVGKIYQQWASDGDTLTQRSEVEKIKIPLKYRGMQAYDAYDIAVVIVSSPFQYKPYVRPVCLDWSLTQLQPKTIGKVAVWTNTAGFKGSESPALSLVEMQCMSYTNCTNQIPPIYWQYITSDKFCASANYVVLCRGDNGGGLVYPETVFNTVRYYIRGIVSTSSSLFDKEQCNTRHPTTFTSITNYHQLIMSHWLL